MALPAMRGARAPRSRARGARPTRRWAGRLAAGLARLHRRRDRRPVDGARARASAGWCGPSAGRAATARELDREHQRDGGGLLLIGLAIVLAVAVWFGGAGPVGHWLARLHPAARSGAIAMALPLLLLLGGVRLMREPPDEEHRGPGPGRLVARCSSPAPACCTWARREPTDRRRDWTGPAAGSAAASAAGSPPRSPRTWPIALLILLGRLRRCWSSPPRRSTRSRPGCSALWRYLVGAPTPPWRRARSSTRSRTNAAGGAPRRGSTRRRQGRLRRRRRGLRRTVPEPLHEAVVVERRPLGPAVGPRRCASPAPRGAGALAGAGPGAAAHARPAGGRLQAPADQPAARRRRRRAPAAGPTTRSSSRCAACSTSSMWTPP